MGMLERGCGDSEVGLLLGKRSWFEDVYLFLGIEKVMFISFIDVIECLDVFLGKCFGGEGGGRVGGGGFGCIGGKGSFGRGGGECGFVVVGFLVVGLVFVGEDGG